MEQNLRLMALARLSLLGFAQFFVLLNQFVFAVEIDLFWAEFCLILLALSAALTFIQLKHPSRHKASNLEQKVKLQLISDVIILSLLFHAAGGAANPFVSILLFPLVISASILPGRFNWFMVILTLSCYGSLFLFEHSMSQHSGMEHAMSGQHSMHSQEVSSIFSLHIIGMWFNFAISAVLISFFVVRMRQEIEQQQTQLNEQREQSLRDEQLLAIATQAASAAHHLGTPLSTMNVIINDLEHDTLFPDIFKEDLDVLASQVANCKKVLNGLRNQAENDNSTESLPQFLAILLDEFRLLRPHVKLSVKGMERIPNNASIISDPALRMAILNILNNAADASPERVIFSLNYENGHLLIDITDFGDGFNLEQNTLPVNSSKQDGLGLGLFLSHATLNRYGGKISLKQQNSNGTQMHLVIPIKP